MEYKGETSIISINNPKAKATNLDHPPPLEPKTTQNGSLKKQKAKNIFKVALYMMRGRSKKSKAILADDESRSIWRKLVGSMRPLHLQSNGSPPPQIALPNNNGQKAKNAADEIHSEEAYESASEVASPSNSRYASAVGLNEMIQEEEEEKEEEEIVKENNGEGDEMIDAKAEEFIAEFYQQMRLQRLDIVDRRYKEISMRSLGL